MGDISPCRFILGCAFHCCEAPFFLICVDDSAGAGCRLHIMPRLLQAEKLSKIPKCKWQIKKNCMNMVHFRLFVLILLSKTCLIYTGDRTFIKFYSFCSFLLIFSESPFITYRLTYKKC